jgi:hypothetical protein
LKSLIPIISAREIVRQGQRGATWFIPSLYRIFAAYGERPGLALLWLGFFVLIAFPLSCISAARPSHLDLSRAVLKSLEVITFLENRQEGATNELRTFGVRVLMGVERIVVSSQVGIFLLALRRLFPQ